MARLGSTKAKTGCFTCKARKVKCDETKPSCRRCTRTKRTCPGYPEVTGQAQYSWAELLAAPSPPLVRSPTSIITTDVQESRALAFFRAQVAPALSRHSSVSFWTVLVAQVSRVEPSVRHALAAISALYEERLLSSATASAAGGEKSMRMERAAFAIGHYNQALGYVKAAGVDRNIVLLVCLLFICIEAMQDDKQMAIQHCRHGILICNNMPAGLSGWAKHELQPIFLRLATFPYFFGTEAGDFPEPVGLVSAGVDSEEAGFDTSSVAWDYLVNRAVRVIRMGLSHRQGPLRWSVLPDTLIDEQLGTLASLIAWRQHLRQQRSRLAVPNEKYENHLFREMECITGQVWVACCIGHSEMPFDEYMVDFEAILSLSQELIDRRISAFEPRRIFSFEMGFTPFLYFIVLKCRRLDLRIKALQHILQVAYDQENLFSTRLLYAVGLRLTEVEHDVKLDPAWPEQPDAALEVAPMPVDEVRVRTVNVTEEKETRVDATGEVSEYRKVYFLVRPEAIVPGYMEWIKVRPCSTGQP